MGKKNFKPHPQNGILVPLRDSFQNFWPAPSSFLFGAPPGSFTATIATTDCLIILLSDLRILFNFSAVLWPPLRRETQSILLILPKYIKELGHITEVVKIWKEHQWHTRVMARVSPFCSYVRLTLPWVPEVFFFVTRSKNFWSRARFLRQRRANDKPV